MGKDKTEFHVKVIITDAKYEAHASMEKTTGPTQPLPPKISINISTQQGCLHHKLF